MAINVIEAPILSTDFYVKGYIDKDTKLVSDKDAEIAEFVENCIFNRMKPDRNQFLYECLKMVRDGVSVFEIILKQDKKGIIIDKLAVRLPITIYKWETSD
jgi:hypothetical protein